MAATRRSTGWRGCRTTTGMPCGIRRSRLRRRWRGWRRCCGARRKSALHIIQQLKLPAAHRHHAPEFPLVAGGVLWCYQRIDYDQTTTKRTEFLADWAERAERGLAQKPITTGFVYATKTMRKPRI